MNRNIIPSDYKVKADWRFRLQEQFKRLEIQDESGSWALIGSWQDVLEARASLEMWRRSKDAEATLASASFNSRLNTVMEGLVEGKDADHESYQDKMDEEAVKREIKKLEEDFQNVQINGDVPDWNDSEEEVDEIAKRKQADRGKKHHRNLETNSSTKSSTFNFGRNNENLTEEDILKRELRVIEERFMGTEGVGASGSNPGPVERTEGEVGASGFWGHTSNSEMSNPRTDDVIIATAGDVTGTSPASPLLSCTMHKGTKVYLYTADITKLRVGAIVNAANERLQHAGGVAFAISDAIGPWFQRDSDRHVRKHGTLPVAGVSVHHVKGMPFSYVINAVGPIWNMYRNKSKCKEALMRTFYNAMRCANDECMVASMAVPPISSGNSSTHYVSRKF